MNDEPVLECRLYIAGDSPNSRRALVNLKELCERAAPDRHRIEIIDVFVDPRRALADGVMLTPQLVVLSPEPVRTIIGDLSDRASMVDVFGPKALSS